jgi:hypothetical protein
MEILDVLVAPTPSPTPLLFSYNLFSFYCKHTFINPCKNVRPFSSVSNPYQTIATKSKINVNPVIGESKTSSPKWQKS